MVYYYMQTILIMPQNEALICNMSTHNLWCFWYLPSDPSAPPCRCGDVVVPQRCPSRTRPLSPPSARHGLPGSPRAGHPPGWKKRHIWLGPSPNMTKIVRGSHLGGAMLTVPAPAWRRWVTHRCRKAPTAVGAARVWGYLPRGPPAPSSASSCWWTSRPPLSWSPCSGTSSPLRTCPWSWTLHTQNTGFIVVRLAMAKWGFMTHLLYFLTPLDGAQRTENCQKDVPRQTKHAFLWAQKEQQMVYEASFSHHYLKHIRTFDSS